METGFITNIIKLAKTDTHTPVGLNMGQGQEFYTRKKIFLFCWNEGQILVNDDSSSSTRQRGAPTAY